MKKLIGVAIVVLLVAVNPMFRMVTGTGYSYGEPEMRRAVEGTWTLTPEHGAAIHFTVVERGRHVPREGLIRSAGACGDRSFVHTADACMDTSSLELAITSADSRLDRGRFHVFAYDFEFGVLELDAGNQLVLDAHVDTAGGAYQVEYFIDGKQVPATLVRM